MGSTVPRRGRAEEELLRYARVKCYIGMLYPTVQKMQANVAALMLSAARECNARNLGPPFCASKHCFHLL